MWEAGDETLVHTKPPVHTKTVQLHTSYSVCSTWVRSIISTKYIINRVKYHCQWNIFVLQSITLFEKCQIEVLNLSHY